jgi:homoserine dehydrogenase
VLSALQSRPDLFRLNPVLVRDPSKPSRPQGASYTADLEEALGNDPDLVVEVIGGADKPAALMQKLLAAGVDVVTANKTAMAHHGPDLRAAAEASGADLRYSAAVGGGMPALETIDAYAGHIRAIEGVMNGTANFLLSALAEGEDFADAVARAQALGFAEADPSADVDSHDAAEKLSLAIWHAFGVYRHPGDIAKASLRDVTPEQVQAAREKGEVLKQVARCSFSKTGGLCADVSILPLRSDDPLARTVAEGNCVSLTLTNGEVVSVHGKGAGRWPTAASVFADIMDIQQAQRGPQRKGKAARVAVSSNAAVKVAVNAGSQVQQ